MTRLNYGKEETRRRFDRGRREDERFGHPIGRYEQTRTPTKFRAKYSSGHCTKCGHPIVQSTPITRATTGGFTHVRCPKRPSSGDSTSSAS